MLVSVVGASPGGSELERAKWAAEVHLRGSGARWTIVRATAYEELWTEIIAGSAARDGRAVVLGRGENPVNVVPVATVARAVADACLDPAPAARSSRCAGPGTSASPTSPRPQCAPGSRPRRVPRTVLRIVGQVARPVRPDVARLARMAALDGHGRPGAGPATAARVPVRLAVHAAVGGSRSPHISHR